MILKIKYSQEFEVTRIKQTLAKLEWYKEHGIRLNLPEGISEDNIQEIIERDFKYNEYKHAEEELLEDFNHIPKSFFSMLEKRTGKKVPADLEVFLTKYGCGGSYKLPNTIIINITAGKKGHGLAYGLKHELIHLMVEEDVQKRKLNQEKKSDKFVML